MRNLIIMVCIINQMAQHVTAWHGDDDSGVRFLVGAMTTKRGEAGERDSVSGQVSCQDLADHELGLLAQSDVLPCSELLHGKNWVVQLRGGASTLPSSRRGCAVVRPQSSLPSPVGTNTW